MRISRILISALACLILVGAVGWWWNHDPERRWGCFGNPEAFCWNCSSFLRNAIRFYAEDHDGWYPQGEKTSVDSLTRLLAYDSTIHVYTSHALAGKLREHHKRTGSFSEEFSCYRYNEGLRAEDPEDLVLLYYYKPTCWRSHSDKGISLGRQVLTNSGMGWDFVSEAEFQARQQKTVAYIRERRLREPQLALVASNLIVTVVCSNLGPNSFRFTADIRNRGEETAMINLAGGAVLIYRGGPSGNSYLLEKRATEVSLPPGKWHQFPGWLEITVEDKLRDGLIIGRTTRTKSYSGVNDDHGTPIMDTGEGYIGPGQDQYFRELNAATWVRASLQCSVDMGDIVNLPIVLKSEEVRYLPTSAAREEPRPRHEHTKGK